MKFVVTGAYGFIGRNLAVALGRRPNDSVIGLVRESSAAEWRACLAEADVVYHLAGVNRPKDPAEYETGNVGSTERLCSTLLALNRSAKLVFASSAQALLENPYAKSKREAEEIVFKYANVSGADVFVYRCPGVFGKWCKPNYNSVVATFCYNIARCIPVTISDPEKEISLVYVDDLVRSFIGLAEGRQPSTRGRYAQVEQGYRVTLGALARTIESFALSRSDLQMPDMNSRFVRALYATFLSYLPTDNFSYELPQRRDTRGELSELFKSPSIGQIFISRTRSGVSRGHHYHDSKVEKFVVLEGEAVIRFRPVGGADIIEYPVTGREFRVVDIPPGYTHSIENVGRSDLVVLFWANEIFDQERPDTYALMV